MPKHVLVITQYFYPEPFRINDICAELVKAGHKVTVITGIPNYPEGKFYKGYGWFKKRKEVWNGVRIIRLPLISRGRSSLRLVMNYYSFVVSGWFWKVFTRIKADVVFTFEVSPLTQAKIGVWYSKKRKIPNYLYVQDLWPDNLEAVGNIKNKRILNHYGKMANAIYKRCDKIFATSPSFVEEIRKRVFDDKDKVVYLPQYAEDFYYPRQKKAIPEIPDDDRFKIIFTGNIGQAQGLDVLPKVAKLLKDEYKDKILFVLVGEGRYKDALLESVKAADVSESFLFVPRQVPEKIPEFLAACDTAFVSFTDNALFNKTIPAKLQSYMACGMPILAVANGETKRVIEEANCGKCVDFGEEKFLADVIREMISDEKLAEYGENARAYYLQNFSKRQVFGEINRIFEECDKK